LHSPSTPTTVARKECQELQDLQPNRPKILFIEATKTTTIPAVDPPWTKTQDDEGSASGEEEAHRRPAEEESRKTGIRHDTTEASTKTSQT
jgi:hypothetical protein